MIEAVVRKLQHFYGIIGDYFLTSHSLVRCFCLVEKKMIIESRKIFVLVFVTDLEAFKAGKMLVNVSVFRVRC